jgi:hypothetical protein
MTNDDLAAHARAIIEANLYLTVGTTDPEGRPWTTPVYFAPAGERDFYWMSATDARHSRHLVERPQVSMVILTPPSRRTTGAPCMRSGRRGSCRAAPSTARWRSILAPMVRTQHR